MKKLMLVLMACLVFVSFGTANHADAAKRGGGGYKSGTKSYAPTTPKNNSVNKSDSGATNKNNSTAATTQNRGFFSGGSFLKGMMIGGLAGMLFGGLLGGMGFMGDMLGLILNLLAIFILIRLIMGVVSYYKRRKMNNEQQHPR